MKKCPYCGEEIQDEAILCRYCHSKLNINSEDIKDSLPDNCGSENPESKNQKKNSKKRIISIVAGILLGSLILLIGIIVLKHIGKEKYFLIIDDVQYDLAADAQEVISKMVQNEVMVIDMSNLMKFGENGLYDRNGFINIQERLDKCCVYVTERMVREGNSDNSIIMTQYNILCNNSEFETTDGICNYSEGKEIESLPGYVVQQGSNGRNKACAAVYRDGKLVELDSYEEQVDNFINYANEYGLFDAIEENNLEQYYFPASNYIFSPFLVWDMMLSENPYIRENLLLLFAVKDMGNQLQQNQLDYFDVIYYQFDEENDKGCDVQFYHYYYGTWNEHRFEQ